jgi:hypothetical protein
MCHAADQQRRDRIDLILPSDPSVREHPGREAAAVAPSMWLGIGAA